jgi:hypothetical protein
MMETLEIMRHRCGKEILIRVLPTLYDTRTKLAREVLSELRNKFREYLMESTVNFNTKLKEAASFGQPITEYDPGSRGYKDFVNLARELMGHRPTETEPTPSEHLSRPAELVQRAKQLTQLNNYQFGRHNLGAGPVSQPQAVPAPVVAISGGRLSLGAQPAPMRSEPVGMPEFPKLAVAEPATAMIDLEAPLPIDSGLRYTDPSRHTLMSMSDLTLNMGNLMTGTLGSSIPANATMIISLPATESVKTTQQKIDEFYGVKQIGGEVIFAARFDNAKSVQIAGDFNNWSPVSTPMTAAAKPGDWKTRVALRPGRYRYRFVVDGRWTTDPSNTYVESNQFGELNNIVEVD